MEQFHQQTYYLIEDETFDQLIQKHFLVPDFQCAPYYEWNGDSEHTCQVGDLDDYTRGVCEEFLQKKSRWAASWGELLEYIADQGIVPKGHYLLQVK